jgi:hypothetical protein
MNSKIIISVVIVLAIGVAAASYQISTTNDLFTITDSPDQSPSEDTASSSSSTGTDQGSSTGSGSSGSSQGGSNVKVTSDEAKTLAVDVNTQPYTTLGTPVLESMLGTKVYVIPVISNGNDPDHPEFKKGQVIGEIYIDAYTGNDLKLGGGGGAP